MRLCFGCPEEESCLLCLHTRNMSEPTDPTDLLLFRNNVIPRVLKVCSHGGSYGDILDTLSPRELTRVGMFLLYMKDSDKSVLAVLHYILSSKHCDTTFYGFATSKWLSEQHIFWESWTSRCLSLVQQEFSRLIASMFNRKKHAKLTTIRAALFVTYSLRSLYGRDVATMIGKQVYALRNE